jgi:hypothetical protein
VAIRDDLLRQHPPAARLDDLKGLWSVRSSGNNGRSPAILDSVESLIGAFTVETLTGEPDSELASIAGGV